MKFSYLGPQANSRADLGFVITAMWVRNRNPGIPPTEDALLENLLIFEYLWGTLPLSLRPLSYPLSLSTLSPLPSLPLSARSPVLSLDAWHAIVFFLASERASAAQC